MNTVVFFKSPRQYYAIFVVLVLIAGCRNQQHDQFQPALPTDKLQHPAVVMGAGNETVSRSLVNRIVDLGVLKDGPPTFVKVTIPANSIGNDTGAQNVRIDTGCECIRPEPAVQKWLPGKENTLTFICVKIVSPGKQAVDVRMADPHSGFHGEFTFRYSVEQDVEIDNESVSIMPVRDGQRTVFQGLVSLRDNKGSSNFSASIVSPLDQVLTYRLRPHGFGDNKITMDIRFDARPAGPLAPKTHYVILARNQVAFRSLSLTWATGMFEINNAEVYVPMEQPMRRSRSLPWGKGIIEARATSQTLDLNTLAVVSHPNWVAVSDLGTSGGVRSWQCLPKLPTEQGTTGLIIVQDPASGERHAVHCTADDSTLPL